MLTFDDQPTIRNAILKRLDKERGVKICDMPMHAAEDCIAVGILALLDDKLVVRSRFDLRPQWQLADLHNEIDEVAEQYKAARRDYWGRGRVLGTPEVQLAGSGTRGRWKS